MLESRLYELELRKQNEQNEKIKSLKKGDRLGKSNSFLCNATIPDGKRFKN